MKIHLVTQVEAWIDGTSGAWRVAAPYTPGSRQVLVELEIQGEEDSCHLIKAPDGFFAADDWYPSLAEALHGARDRFGVSEDSWLRAEEAPPPK